MSYIAFDLDALNVCSQVGAACGLSAPEASHGLLLLWAWCFRAEKVTATDVHLRGFFQGKDAGPALEAFGFLERQPDGWRVRGAERYLRVKESRRAGARITNEKRRSDKGANAHARSKSVRERTLMHALTPSTEHLTPSTESKNLEPARSRVLSDRLVASFLEKRRTPYKFTSSVDGPALARLLKACPDNDEIDRRWRLGLDGTYQREVNTIAQLDAKWNALTKPDAKERPRDEETTYETQTWIGGVRQ